MVIHVKEIFSKEDIEVAKEIRKEVFVIEQNVSIEEEMDEFDNIAHHYLASIDAIPAGTARWRNTSNGYKLERFAVLRKFRGAGVGSALVEKIMEDIESEGLTKNSTVYLHAQESAVKLYEKYNFAIMSEMFMEANIPHYLMEYQH